MHKTESYKNAYNLLLLFIFLFAALMSLLYIEQIKSVLPQNVRFYTFGLAAIVVVDSLLAASLNGIIVLPSVSLAFGALAALEADRIREAICLDERIWLDAIWLFLLTALHFIICAWGMKTSSELRELMESGDKELCLRQERLAYTIMLVGTAILAATLGLIKI